MTTANAEKLCTCGGQPYITTVEAMTEPETKRFASKERCVDCDQVIFTALPGQRPARKPRMAKSDPIAGVDDGGEEAGDDGDDGEEAGDETAA